MGRPRAPYPSEFRSEAVRLVETSGRSQHEIASELGISQGTLSTWVREARTLPRPEPLAADERSELVLFDINRSSGLVPFIRQGDAVLLSRLTDASPRRYRRTLVTNVDAASLAVAERTIAPGAPTIDARPLGLAWKR